MNYYKKHIGDYVRDTAHLTLLEHGVYARLLDIYYTNESGVPDAQVERLIGARTEEERFATRAVLSEFFVLATPENRMGFNSVSITEPTWKQARCERELDQARARAKINRESAKKGGRPRKPARPPYQSCTSSQRSSPKTESVSKSDHEGPQHGNQLGSESINPLIHQSTNPPIQEGTPPDDPDGSSSPPQERARAPDRLKGPKRGRGVPSGSAHGTRIPAGWEPSEDSVAYARQFGLDPRAILEEFRDYWLAAAGAKGRKADWQATWRTWCRRAHGEQSAPPAPPRKPPNGSAQRSGGLVSSERVFEATAEAHRRKHGEYPSWFVNRQRAPAGADDQFAGPTIDGDL